MTLARVKDLIGICAYCAYCACRYEGTIKELKERVAKLSDTGRRLQADNDKLKNTLIKRDATIHMRELDITKLNERIVRGGIVIHDEGQGADHAIVATRRPSGIGRS